jgi:CRP/FNR family transcriptional regulator, cyclic AMP receptor protein
MKTILIIEDNLEVRENAAEILELSRYKVLTAENGKEGAETAIREKPDLIICDIMMPQLDGYGVLHLLSKHPETASIPFIFLTAKSDKADVRKGMELGADDYLIKPFEGIELLNAVEVRLKKYERLQEKMTGAASLNAFIKTAEQKAGIKLTSEEREVNNYNKKHVLYKEGQRPRELYYIVTGKIKVYRAHPDGKDFIIGIYGAGDFIGYQALLEESNYKDSAEVLETAEVMQIPKDDFMQLISTDIDIAKQFIQLFTKETAEKEEQLVNLAYSSLRRKVAYGLSKLTGGETKEINLSRDDLAQSVGVAKESLIRTLTDFKEEGLIDIDKSRIIIKNAEKLKDLPF